MPTRDQRIARLREMTDEAASPEGRKEVAKALAMTQNRVVQAAARVAEAWRDEAFAGELAAAFDRFMADAAKSDPGCVAKVAIVRALHAIGHVDFDLYLRASRHVQREPVFGPPEDTAPELRVIGVDALAELGYPDWDYEVVRLMSDPEPNAQRGAVHLLGQRGGREAELLLRLTASSTARDPDLVSACLDALMAVNPQASCSFVDGFLHSRDRELVEAAALALGESRLPEAFACLKRAWSRNAQEYMREPLVLALAIHRSDEAFALLVDVIRDARVPMAVRALRALGIYRGDEKKVSDIRAAVNGRSEPELRHSFEQTFEAEES